MWTDNIIDACEALINAGFSNQCWQNIRSAYDGIVFQASNGDTYKYFLHTKEIRKLKNWKEARTNG